MPATDSLYYLYIPIPILIDFLLIYSNLNNNLNKYFDQQDIPYQNNDENFDFIVG